MLFYYQNPKSRDLIIFNSEEKEVVIVEPLKVKVFTGTNVTIEEPVEEETEVIDPRPGKKGKGKISVETIEQIKKMREKGKTIQAISEELGVSAMTVWKYSKE